MNRVVPESRGEEAVVGDRRPPTLNVPEDGGAGFDTGSLLDLVGDDFADPTEANRVRA